METQTHHAVTSAQRARDDAFRRISRARGMTILGAGALTAGLAGLVSAVAPGRSFGARTKIAAAARTLPAPPRPTTSTRRALTMPPLASPKSLGLGAPASAPQPAVPANQGPPASDPQSQQAAPSPQPSAPVAPQPVQPQPVAPQPAPSSGGGGVVSGGS
jgi:F0F1-type ATP synthase membrane subunit c/vacuolar-type H+-ATPase subunit K